MQFPYTILRKKKKLLSLKVVLKEKSTSVNWLRLTYPSNYLMIKGSTFEDYWVSYLLLQPVAGGFSGKRRRLPM